MQADYRGVLDSEGMLEEIRTQLSEKDRYELDFLSDGWDGSKLCEDFYTKAAASRNHFIRDYFSYDLQLRNAKVAYLNKSLERPEGQDIMPGAGEDFEDAAKADEALAGQDILGRERALDELLWAKIDALTVMHVFDLDVVLGFVAKLRIVGRWLSLDEATGRELFRKMVEEIKETGKNKVI